MPLNSASDATLATNRDYFEIVGLERTSLDIREFVATARFAAGPRHIVNQPPSRTQVQILLCSAK